jgi:DNA-directed RNA polymerase subunit RPC12/RpoP
MSEHFRCEDCGHEFPKTRFEPDIEDDAPLVCPNCGGMDIELVRGETEAA